MRKIALAVAATLVGATAAYAQVTPPAVTDPAAVTRATATGFIEFQAADELLATDLLGRPVLNRADETLGTVNNILFSYDGQAVALVVGVGGFLGIGVKDVAIAYDAVAVTVEENRTIRLVVDASRDALDTATAFQTLDQLGIAPMVPAVPAPPAPAAITPEPAPAVAPEPAPAVAPEPAPAVAPEPAPAVAPEPAPAVAPEPAPAVETPAPAPAPAVEPAPVEPLAITPLPAPAPVAAVPPAPVNEGPMVITAPPMVIAAPTATAAAAYVATQGAGEVLATEMIGRPVQNLAGETLGNITDLLQTRDGTISAVIVGVGGFLGIGVKNVAISLDALSIGVIDGEWVFVFGADRAALDAAPAFQRLP
ncbi:MAG: PRC-barrel domain-containing protein [Bauldia sp.]|nr:PRC-barrel domain-containing protein [Bauldia sp.]